MHKRYWRLSALLMAGALAVSSVNVGTLNVSAEEIVEDAADVKTTDGVGSAEKGGEQNDTPAEGEAPVDQEKKDTEKTPEENPSQGEEPKAEQEAGDKKEQSETPAEQETPGEEKKDPEVQGEIPKGEQNKAGEAAKTPEENEGEIGFEFYNFSDEDAKIAKGEKIGQGIITRYLRTENDLNENSGVVRAGGFGSTGK